VLLAVCEEFDIEFDSSTIPGIAFGFAGGIGNSGAVCGAVVGAVMAISLKLGKGDTMEEAIAKLDVPQEFRRRFEAEMGAYTCRELTGADLTTAESRMKYMDSDIPQTVCFPAVAAAYRIVSDMLREQG